jgi:hypothetical protein
MLYSRTVVQETDADLTKMLKLILTKQDVKVQTGFRSQGRQ